MSIQRPPRLTGNPSADVGTIADWAYKLYAELILALQIPRIFNAMKAVTPLDIDISPSPTQAEVTAVKDKLNQIIAIFNIQES